jgi:hypothetical protein
MEAHTLIVGNRGIIGVSYKIAILLLDYAYKVYQMDQHIDMPQEVFLK